MNRSRFIKKIDLITILLSLSISVLTMLFASNPLYAKTEVLFSPRGSIKDAIIKNIISSKDTIDVTAFTFTAGDIAEALYLAKERGVKDVAFHKKRGLTVMDMVKSNWVYRKLRNFRAGIEAGISCLKRAYGLGRCTWKGMEHYAAYVWSSIVAYNLALFTKLRPA